MEKDQGWEPQTPHDHLLHGLHIQYSEYENELVEDEVPEFILEMLKKKKERCFYNLQNFRVFVENTVMIPDI